MRILGIDPSTRFIGWALLEGTQLTTWVSDLTKCATNLEKLEQIDASAFKVSFQPTSDLRVLVEATYTSFNPAVALALAKVGGWIEAQFASWDVPVEFVPTLSAKSAATGHVSAPKGMTRPLAKEWWRKAIEHEAKSRWGEGVVLGDEHQGDACALVLYALKHPPAHQNDFKAGRLKS